MSIEVILWLTIFNLYQDLNVPMTNDYDLLLGVSNYTVQRNHWEIPFRLFNLSEYD